MSKLKSVLEKFNQVQKSLKEEGTPTQSLYGSELFFRPQVGKTENKSKFKIRFLNVEESPTGRPWVQYNFHMWKSSTDNKTVKILDPHNFDPKAPNPIAELSRKLYKSNNALDQDLAKTLYRKRRYFSIVYVKEAPEHQKQYVGKVLIFEYGDKINGKLTTSISDSGSCFYDPYKGQDFLVVVKTVNNQPNYDDSMFIGSAGCPISENEKELEAIGEQLDKINIKDAVLKANKMKDANEMAELLDRDFGSKYGTATTSTAHQKFVVEVPAKNVMTNESVSAQQTKMDFGEPEEKPKNETPKPSTKVEVEPEGSLNFDASEFNFNDEDFK